MGLRTTLPAIGWREWVALPELGIDTIKAKIDTGARSSALHAPRIDTCERDGRTLVHFEVAPHQRDNRRIVLAEAPLLDCREVRSSDGRVQQRYALLTTVTVGPFSWPIELTLTNRDTMGFRLLLGRQAVRDRFLVNAGRSYLYGKPDLP